MGVQRRAEAGRTGEKKKVGSGKVRTLNFEVWTLNFIVSKAISSYTREL